MTRGRWWLFDRHPHTHEHVPGAAVFSKRPTVAEIEAESSSVITCEIFSIKSSKSISFMPLAASNRPCKEKKPQIRVREENREEQRTKAVCTPILIKTAKINENNRSQ